MEIHLFGATTAVGEALRQCQLLRALPNCNLFCYSRSVAGLLNSFYVADLDHPSSYSPAGDPCKPKIWISFAPVWKFGPFIDELAVRFPDRLSGLSGLIVCSSSSVITKRFSVNSFDRALVARLSYAEEKVFSAARNLDVPCCILQPTLIYGQVGVYSDKNLTRLLHLMRRIPFFPLPAQSGLRQPIHATQLAAVSLAIAQQLARLDFDSFPSQRIAVGGDTTLTYASMIRSLQEALPVSDLARRCSVFPIPNRLFFLLAAPLLLRSPKIFEAVLRTAANLSGFTSAYELLGSDPQPFPLHPLA